MAFTQVSFGSLISQLAVRLGDTNHIFWSREELRLYLIDALRTFNGLTAFWRESRHLSVVSGQDFYDLPTIYPDLCGFSVTSDDVIGFMQYQLLEPVSPLSWTGSAQFTLSAVVESLNRRMDAMQFQAGMVQRARTLPIAPVPGFRTVLPDDIVDLRHVHWLSRLGTRSPLVRDDEWSADLFQPVWQVSPEFPPTAYSVATSPPLTVQVLGAPSDGGMLRLLSVENVAPLVTGVDGVLGLPDDWTWVVRFGALADLLGQEGIGSDVLRSQYCQRRWMEGVALARRAQCALSVRLNTGENLQVFSIAELEAFGSEQMLMPGTPSMGVVSGFTTLMLAPIADAGNYGAVIDLNRKMPVPEDDTAFVQLPRPIMEALVGYGEHLAAFKMGGDEFARTMPLLDQFYATCGLTTDHFRALIPNYDQLSTLAMKDEQIVPREVANG